MVPVLIDGERTVWDSLAICLYLGDRHAGVWPEAESAKAWARCVACEMHSGFSALRNDCTMNVGVRVRRNPDSAALKRDLARIREIFEEGLERFGGPFLAGEDFTAADAFYAPVVFRVRGYGIDPGAAWKRLGRAYAGLARDARNGKAALSESYREEGHEAELAAAGTIMRTIVRHEGAAQRGAGRT
jgi:glutathione S-transferase